MPGKSSITLSQLVAQFPVLRQEVGVRLWLLLGEMCGLDAAVFGTDAELPAPVACLLRVYATLVEHKRLDIAEIRFIVRHFREKLLTAYNEQQLPAIMAIADNEYVQLLTGDKRSRWLALRAGHEIDGNPPASVEGLSYNLTDSLKADDHAYPQPPGNAA